MLGYQMSFRLECHTTNMLIFIHAKKYMQENNIYCL